MLAHPPTLRSRVRSFFHGLLERVTSPYKRVDIVAPKLAQILNEKSPDLRTIFEIGHQPFQNLLFFAQVMHVHETGKPLFRDEIMIMVEGPHLEPVHRILRRPYGIYLYLIDDLAERTWFGMKRSVTLYATASLWLDEQRKYKGVGIISDTIEHARKLFPPGTVLSLEDLRSCWLLPDEDHLKNNPQML